MARGKVRVSITGDSSGLKRSTHAAEQDLDRFSRRGATSMDRLKRAGIAAGAAAAAGLAVGLVKAGKETVAFDKSMRNVNSIAQLSEQRFGALQKSVLGLAGKTAQAPKTLADGLYDIVSSGFEGADALKVLQASAKAATAGLTTTEVSGKAVAAVLNAYRLPAKEASKVSDQLFRTVDRGVVSFEELSQNIGDVLPFAATLGIGLDEVGASISTMTKAGISAPETMTRIKSTMQTMLKPSKDMRAAFKELGVESGEALIKQEGFQGALEALARTTGNSKAEMAKLFPNVRALGGALALTGDNAKGAREDLKGLEGAAGATDRALAQQSKSIAFQWGKAKASLSAVAITVGNEVVPAVAKAAGSVASFVTEIQTGEGAGGRFAATMKDIAAVIWPVVRAVGQVISSVAQFAGGVVQLIGPTTALGAVMGGLAARFVALRVAVGVSAVLSALPGILWGTTGAMAALNAVMRANPFVLVATVVGTVAGALLGMKAKTDSAKVSGEQLNSMLRQQADLMRQVRDIDISTAQAKANLKSANVSVTQAEQRLRDLRKSGTASATEIKAAEADLEQARINQERAQRGVSDAEDDGNRVRREAVDQANKIIEVDRERLEATNKDIAALKRQKAEFEEVGVSMETTGRTGKAYRDIVAQLSDKQRKAHGTTIRLKEQQLKLAEATGASRHTVDRLKAEIAGLKSKTVTVTAKVKMQATSQALQSVRALLGGDGTPRGAGWPLTGKELDEAVTKDARRLAQGRADRLAGQVSRKAMSSVRGLLGGLGGRGASSVDAFTPISLRMGLSGARGRGQGYRPGDPGWHGVNRARDHSGPPGKMMAFARYLASNFGKKLKELIYTPLGFSIKNGRKVPPFAQADHYDHVHVAMRRGGTVPGTGQGDTRPAMLEPGEFVIRKKVVERFGPTFFTALNGGNGDGTGMGFMSGGQVARLARRAGFRGRNLVTALAIARGESGWREGATNRNTDGSIDRGLWQINSVHGALSTMNPAGNARAAWRISKGGRDWSPWVVFQKGLHRRHIAAARRAALATRPGRGRPSRGTRGGGGGDGGRDEPHPLDVLPPIHERRMAVADIALARAESTPGTVDDVRAQQRKLAAIDTRIKRVRGALRKKLRPGTRARLRLEYAGLLRERQGLIGEMTPEAGVPPTLEDFQAQRTALAGLTPGLGDDLSAAQNAYQLAERRYMEALPGGDPRQIAEAANNVRAAADQVNQLREQMATLEEQVRQAAEAERRLWPNAELAMAQLTETLDDDLQATEKLNAINEDLYRQAVAANDPARIAETAGQLKSTRDAIAQLNSTLQQQQAAEQERLRIMESIALEMKRENDRAEHINAITGREATRALGDLISGEIAGRGYQGRALTAGAGSVYRA